MQGYQTGRLLQSLVMFTKYLILSYSGYTVRWHFLPTL